MLFAEWQWRNSPGRGRRGGLCEEEGAADEAKDGEEEPAGEETKEGAQEGWCLDLSVFLFCHCKEMSIFSFQHDKFNN